MKTGIVSILTLILLLSGGVRATTTSTTTTTQSTPLPEKINEVSITAFIPELGTFTRGMGFLCVPGEEKTISLQYEFPADSESLSFANTPSGKHQYEIGRKINLGWSIDGGKILKSVENSIIWQAPRKPGDYKIRAVHTEERRWGCDDTFLPVQRYVGQIELRAIVQYPFNPVSDTTLEGYAIGVYPDENGPGVVDPVASHRTSYRPPRFFIKVTPLNEDIKISPHFSLGDFSRPQEKGKTRFIALKYSIVNRLELIIDLLQKKGKRVKGLKILRGYVSPLEKERLKREGIYLSEFSRFLYGDAAAIIVDEDNDNKLDDLNGDGKVDVADARWLAEIVEQAEMESRLPGGIGIYNHFKDTYYPDTPYVQVDTRGWRSRWSDLKP